MKALALALLLTGCTMQAAEVECTHVHETPATACTVYTYKESQWDAEEKAWLRQVAEVDPVVEAQPTCHIRNQHLQPSTLFAYDARTGNLTLDREQIAEHSAWHVVPSKLRQERSGSLLQSIVAHLVQHSMGVSHPEPEVL